MSETESRASTWAIRILLAIAVALGVYFVARSAGEDHAGPVPIEWDREACAECHMHVGDPRFAAQLQTRDGQVLNFDDPGCLFVYLDRAKPEVHALWFHHGEGEHWLSEREVRFAPSDKTPMGYGLVAVTATTPGAIPLDAARSTVQKLVRQRGAR